MPRNLANGSRTMSQALLRHFSELQTLPDQLEVSDLLSFKSSQHGRQSQPLLPPAHHHTPCRALFSRGSTQPPATRLIGCRDWHSIPSLTRTPRGPRFTQNPTVESLSTPTKSRAGGDCGAPSPVLSRCTHEATPRTRLTSVSACHLLKTFY